MFRPRPLLKTGLPANNALGRNGGGLPGWASSSDFQDFEDGADGRLQAVQYGGGSSAATEEPFASQIADGVRDRQPGIEPTGAIVTAAKPVIMQELQRGGFNDQDAQSLYESANKIPDTFWVWPPGRMDTKVTPGDDKAYRGQADRVISNEALRKRAVEFYERQFGNGGRLRRVDR